MATGDEVGNVRPLERSVCGDARLDALLRGSEVRGLKGKLVARWKEKARAMAFAVGRQKCLRVELSQVVELANASQAGLIETEQVLLMILDEEKGESHEETGPNEGDDVTGGGSEPDSDSG